MSFPNDNTTDKALPFINSDGTYNRHYNPTDDTFGTYTFPELVVTANHPSNTHREQAKYKQAGREGYLLMDRARRRAYPFMAAVAGPIVGGAALPAMGATGFGTALKGTLATVKPVLDAVDTGISLSTGDYLGAVSNFLPYDKIGTLFNKLIQHGYYVPKTKKFLKEGLDRALKEGVITADEYKDLLKIKIKTDYSGNFHNLGGDGIAVAPKYKGQDGGFSLFHELGHEIEARRLKNSDDFMGKLARTFATHGKDYKYGDVTDLDRLLSELFADRFAFNLAGSKSLNFSKDASNPDLIYRFKHYLRNKDWDAEYTAAIKNGDLLKAQELRDLHFLHVSGKPISQKVFRGTHNPSRTSFSTKINDPEVGEMYGIYFTPSKKYAKEYGEIKSYFTNVHHPLITKGGWTGIINGNKFNKIVNKGYDHIINTNFDKSLFKKRPEVIVFDPYMIKSTDAITYDNFGNIIPLSQRDNFKLNDIRFKKGGIIKQSHDE